MNEPTREEVLKTAKIEWHRAVIEWHQKALEAIDKGVPIQKIMEYYYPVNVLWGKVIESYTRCLEKEIKAWEENH